MVSICFNRYYARKERCCSAGALTAGVVDGVVPGQNQLGDGHKGIALLGQLLQNGGQRLRGVKGRVMKEHDGPRPHLAGHPLGNLLGRNLLPVQAVTIGNRFKQLTSTIHSPLFITRTLSDVFVGRQFTWLDTSAIWSISFRRLLNAASAPCCF